MKRFWEIDAIRGLSVILMVIYHGIYLLVWFGLIQINLYSGWIWVVPRLIAGSFIFIMGLSLTLSYDRVKDKLSTKNLIIKFLKRGLFILILGFLVTLGTALVFGTSSSQRIVFFGILHMIGLSILIAIPLIKLKWTNLFIGMGVMLLGIGLGFYRFPFFILLWLGFRPEAYAPVDYLPLLPWFSFVCFGLFTGRLLYPEGQTRFKLPELSKNLVVKSLTWIGRHSLWIYLIHVPVIYGVLVLLTNLI